MSIIGFIIALILLVALVLVVKWAMTKFEVEEPLRTAIMLIILAMFLIWLFGYGGLHSLSLNLR